MAGLLIQDGSLRFRPNGALALSDCPDCCGGGGCDCRCPGTDAIRPPYCCDPLDPRYNNAECRCEPTCMVGGEVVKFLPLCCGLPVGAPGSCAGEAACDCANGCTPPSSTNTSSVCHPSHSQYTGFYSCPGLQAFESWFASGLSANDRRCANNCPVDLGSGSVWENSYNLYTYNNNVGGRAYISQSLNRQRSFSLFRCLTGQCTPPPDCAPPTIVPGLDSSAGNFNIVWGPQPNPGPVPGPGSAFSATMQAQSSGYSSPGATGAWAVSTNTVSSVVKFSAAGAPRVWVAGGEATGDATTAQTGNCGGSQIQFYSSRSAYFLVIAGPIWPCQGTMSPPIQVHPMCANPQGDEQRAAAFGRRRIRLATGAETLSVASGAPLPRSVGATSGGCSNCQDNNTGGFVV